MSGITLAIDGLEDVAARIVDERHAAQSPDPWLTTPEAAQYLGIALATVYDLVNDGKLPRHGVKHTRLRFRRSDLDAYAEARR